MAITAKSVDELKKATASALTISGNDVKVLNWSLIRGEAADTLAWTVAFSPDAETRATGAWLIRVLAKQAGNGPASIHDVYMAKGKGALPTNFTVPAINIRQMAYDYARAIFRVAKKHQAGALICEIARSEMGYTAQPPMEYASSILAAALREDYPFPVFIQGDHFQINAKAFAKDAKAEIEGLKKMCVQSIDAGFYNIDIDSSTLVDLAKGTLDEQQALNYGKAIEISDFVRAHQPKGVTVSLGGEIGEVGSKNSTVEELEAFMNGYNKGLKPGQAGLSKLSVQTGTSHGGVVLPDGTLAKVKVDFDTLEKLSAESRAKFGMGGAVQHGASTLPTELFDRFPQTGTCEIHLATEFQNIMYEHPQFPAALKNEIYEWLKVNAANERKEGESDSQFLYKARKKAIGPFKAKLWGMPQAAKDAIIATLTEKVELLFRKLNVGGTGPAIKPFVPLPDVSLPAPAAAKAGGAEHFEGDD
ncbi:MAG: class II fructose-bisphosphate aldolase [Candidatus Coatesbacteria bacterium]